MGEVLVDPARAATPGRRPPARARRRRSPGSGRNAGAAPRARPAESAQSPDQSPRRPSDELAPSRLAPRLAARRLSAHARGVRGGDRSPGRAGRPARRADGSGHPPSRREEPARSRSADGAISPHPRGGRRAPGHARAHAPDDRAGLDAGGDSFARTSSPGAKASCTTATPLKRPAGSTRGRPSCAAPGWKRRRAPSSRRPGCSLAPRARWSPIGGSTSTSSSGGSFTEVIVTRGGSSGGARWAPLEAAATAVYADLQSVRTGVDTRLAIHPADMRRAGTETGHPPDAHPPPGAHASRELHELPRGENRNRRAAASRSDEPRLPGTEAYVFALPRLARGQNRPTLEKGVRTSGNLTEGSGAGASPARSSACAEERLTLPPANPDEAAPLPIDLVLWGAGINVAVRSFFRRFFGWKRYAGDAPQICRQVVDDCWTGEFFAGSDGHFKQFWTRDLAMCTPALCRLGLRDKVVQSLAWGLDAVRAGRAHHDDHLQPAVPARRLRLRQRFAADAALRPARGRRHPPHRRSTARCLTREIERYLETVFDPTLGMARATGYFSGPRDCMTGRSTVFANTMIALLIKLLDVDTRLAEPARRPRHGGASSCATTGWATTSATRSAETCRRATPTSGPSSSGS